VGNGTLAMTAIFSEIRQFATARNLAIALVIMLIWGLVGANLHNPAAVSTAAAKKYQQQLQSQVQNSNGTPTTGRDPSSQTQNSLASAASKPSGTGLRTDTVASGVTADTNHHVDPGNTMQGMDMGGSATNGVLSNGCLADYGIPGQQCLTPYAPNNQPLTCTYVRQQFPQGIKVTGSDTRHLDTNGDGTACSSGD
jgi:hypothetical protein